MLKRYFFGVVVGKGISMLCSSICSILFWKMFLPHPFITYLASHIILHQCSLTLNVRSHMQNANQLNYSWLPPTVEPTLLFGVNEPMFQTANKHWFCEKKWWTATIFNCFVFFITGISFVCCFSFFVWLCFCFCFWEKGRQLIERMSLHSLVFSYEGELERKMM